MNNVTHFGIWCQSLFCFLNRNKRLFPVGSQFYNIIFGAAIADSKVCKQVFAFAEPQPAHNAEGFVHIKKQAAADYQRRPVSFLFIPFAQNPGFR